MATKNNPGAFDCYEKAAPDEPLFVLLARDVTAPQLVEDWARRREELIGLGIKPDTPEERAQIQEARDCAAAMRAWHSAPRAKPKTTDAGSPSTA